jgi:hypothetical protein
MLVERWGESVSKWYLLYFVFVWHLDKSGQLGERDWCKRQGKGLHGDWRDYGNAIGRCGATLTSPGTFYDSLPFIHEIKALQAFIQPLYDYAISILAYEMATRGRVITHSQ